MPPNQRPAATAKNLSTISGICYVEGITEAGQSCLIPIPATLPGSNSPGFFPLLESARRRTKPRTVDLYDVFCGVLYLLKSGCQWRMLPADFPDWRTCYKYFRQWSERAGPEEESILERVLKKN